MIKVPKQLQKTRLDYVMLQLYLHQLVKKNLQGQLRYTYNNPIKQHEFGDWHSYNNKNINLSMGDVLQLLTIVYNIGHFYNTFTASRAVIMMASQEPTFKAALASSVNCSCFNNAMSAILNEHNYQRFHLLNSLLILERCDSNKQSVSLAKEILYAYLNENSLQENSKLHYGFSIFRSIRTVSYLAYDLQIANTPLIIDLCDEEGMLLILRELLSEYNNTLPLKEFVKSVSKLLDDTVYNENANAICYYQISKKIVSYLKQAEDFTLVDYYNELFWNEDSCLNRVYVHKRDYVQEQILKITFDYQHRFIAENLRIELDRIHHTRVVDYVRTNNYRLKLPTPFGVMNLEKSIL